MNTIATLLLPVLAATALAAQKPSVRVATPKPPERLAHFDAMGKPVVFPDGTVALYFIDVRGPGLTPTPAVQDLRVRLSKDNGKTWSDYESLFSFPASEGGFGFHDALVDLEGEVHIFMLCDGNTGVIKSREARDGKPAVEPITRQRLDIWHVRSTGQRTKWSQPRRIWEGRGGDLQSVTQLRGGRIILPFCYVVPRSWRERGEGAQAFTTHGQFDTSVIYSDDGGARWQKSKSVLRTPVPAIGANGGVEPVVIQLNDDRVWMLIRTQNGRFFESFSKDGSAWSPAQPTAILSSDSPAGLVRLPDKRLVMLWNNCQRYPYAQGSRNVLHAAISDDDGRTWKGRREILRDPKRNEPPPPGGDHGVAYPYPRLMRDGRILYTMWVQTGEGRSVEAFDPEWLLQTSDRDDFAGGLERWSVYGGKGAGLTSHAGSADGKVLGLQKTGADWPCAAVWNFPSAQSGSLKLRVLVEPGFGGATLMLTDHFSVPFDSQDRFFSVYRVSTGDLKLATDRWTDLELRWNGPQRSCAVSIDGKVVTVLPELRENAGSNYLRIRCETLDSDKGRLLIDTVEMKAAD